jgi:uncharacterized protein
MKKRLRKKKHYGEYTQWGRQIIITRNRKDGFDKFLDEFLDDAVEANGCFCGGVGKEDKLTVVVELGRRTDDPAARLVKITSWLDAREDVQGWQASEEFDVWHGDFPALDAEME